MNRYAIVFIACVISISSNAQSGDVQDSPSTFVDPYEDRNTNNQLSVSGPFANATIGPDIGIPIPTAGYSMTAHYLEKLYRDMVKAPLSVAERLSLEPNKLDNVYLFLLQVKQENQKSSQLAMIEMCAAWELQNGSATTLERARAALSVHRHIMSTPSNKYISSADANFQSLLGEEGAQLLREDMANYAKRTNLKMIYFADMVSSIGREVEQMNLSCGA